MKLKIRGKALLFIGMAGLCTSLLLGLLFLWGMSAAERLLDSRTEERSEAVTLEAERFAGEEMQKHLEAVVSQKAACIELFMIEMRGEVRLLAQQVTTIMREGGGAAAMQVHDPRYETVGSGQLYFLAGAAGGSPGPSALRAAAAGEVMVRLAESHQVAPLLFSIGSREGWSIRMDFLPPGQQVVSLPLMTMTPDYDARDRNWYRAGQEVMGQDQAVFLPLYTSLGGGTLITCAMPYEDEQGFAGVVGLSLPPAALYQEMEGEVLSGDKIDFALNTQGQVVFSSAPEGVFSPDRPEVDLRNTEEESLAAAAREMLSGKSGSRRVQVGGEDYYLVYAPIGETGWSLGELVNSEEVLSDARSLGLQVRENLQELQGAAAPLFPRMRLLLLCSFGLLLLVLAYVSWRWASRFTAPLQALSAGVGRVAGGHFEEKLSLSTGDETEELAESFNTMTADLQAYMDSLAAAQAEKAKVEAGLDVAASIQQGLLPREIPQSEKFSLHARMEPAKEVSGDFYDFYFLDERHLVLTVAGVANETGEKGRGIPAALFMAMARLVLRNCLLSERKSDLATVCRRARRRIGEESREGLSLTAFVGVLDTRNGELSYVNTASPALLMHRDSLVSLPGSAGGEIRQQRVRLSPGDLLCIYTGSIAIEGLQEKIPAATSPTNLSAIMTALLKETGQEGDITVLALQWEV